MADVFISYSKKDRAIAEALAGDLKAEEIDVWWDFELYAGGNFHDAILAALDAAKAVIVIWSDSAVASVWVRDEATRAARHGKLISCHVPGFGLEKLPLGFGQYQCESVADRTRLMRALWRFGVVANVKPETPETPSAETFLASGNSWYEKGNYDRAKAYCKQAIKLKPDYAEAYLCRGDAYEEIGCRDNAIADYNQANKLKPDFADSLYFRRLLNVSEEMRERTFAAYRKAIEINPKNGIADMALEQVRFKET